MGSQPSPPEQQFQYGVQVRGQLEQAEEFEVLHYVADRGGGEFFRHGPRQGAGAYGIAGGEVAFDDAAKDFARAVVHFGQYL